MVTARLLTGIVLVAQVALIIPIALSLVRIDRNPLDVNERLARLQREVGELVKRPCDAESEWPCQEKTGHEVWEWSPRLALSMKLLVDGSDTELNAWSDVVQAVNEYAQGLARDFSLPLVIDSSVTFEANVQLLKQASTGNVITAEAVRKSIQRIVDEAEVGGSGDLHTREVRLIAVSLRPGNFTSQYLSYRIPSWGLVSFATPLSASAGVFQRYVYESVFGLQGAARTEADTRLARRRALGRGLASALKELSATKTLADHLPRLPVPEKVSRPFEAALDSIEKSLADGVDVFTALEHVRQASLLAQGISTDPSLIPELYISDENMVAIFAPLVFPALLPLLLGVVHEIRTALRSKRV